MKRQKHLNRNEKRVSMRPRNAREVKAGYLGVAEVLDSKGVWHVFGLSRPLLYVLKDQGFIKSISLRRRGCATGKRLWDVRSIRAFLRDHIEEVKSSP